MILVADAGNRTLEGDRVSPRIRGTGAAGDPGMVATAIASMLGLSVQSADATPALLAYPHSKRMLIVLDTCEHLIDAVAAQTSQIYAKAPQVHILTTSREVLQVEREHA